MGNRRALPVLRLFVALLIVLMVPVNSAFATIESKDNDRAMIWLLEEILVKEVPLYDAVAELNEEMVLDFEYHNILKLFSAV